MDFYDYLAMERESRRRRWQKEFAEFALPLLREKRKQLEHEIRVHNLMQYLRSKGF